MARINPDKQPSESINQSNVGPSTPERPSGPSLEEQPSVTVSNDTLLLEYEASETVTYTTAGLSMSERTSDLAREENLFAPISDDAINSTAITNQALICDTQKSDESTVIQSRINSELVTCTINSQEQSSTPERPFGPSLEERETPNPSNNKYHQFIRATQYS